MSNAVFPELPGLSWGIGKVPEFNTGVQRAASGFELRAAFMAYPLWTFRLAYEVLRNGDLSELNSLMGFFLARQGSFDSFLYTDPTDCAVTDMQFATGDGSTKSFQLSRAFGAGGFTFTEPVQNVNALTNIKDAGATKAQGVDYTVNSTGLVTFGTAPANGDALTWTGTFYYRVRFLKDASEFEEFMKDLWANKKIEFVGSPLNKV